MHAREVIGIATLVILGGQNLNFAIPLKYIEKIQRDSVIQIDKQLKATIPATDVKQAPESKPQVSRNT